jgi:hypothetical protein
MMKKTQQQIQDLMYQTTLNGHGFMTTIVTGWDTDSVTGL